MPMEIQGLDAFLLDKFMRQARFLNNNFQLLWRAATPRQKRELEPIMAGWVYFYNEKFYKSIWIGDKDWKRFKDWEKTFQKLRDKFEAEKTDLTTVPDYGPTVEDVQIPFAEVFKSFVSAIKWISIPIVGYYGVKVFFALREDIKATASDKKERHVK